MEAGSLNPVLRNSQSSHHTIRSQFHPDCVVCSPTNPRGLNITFDLDQEEMLTGTFCLDQTAQGYPGLSHGGVIAAVLDGVMGHWLFAHSVVAVTIELNVSFRQPLHLEKDARAEAWLKEVSDPMYVLKAHICQEDRVVARATGRFVHNPDIASTSGTNIQLQTTKNSGVAGF